MGNIHKEKAKIQRQPRHARWDVVGFGENSLDLVAIVADWPERDTKQSLAGFEQMSGGQVATAMRACARLGCRARYIGVFGDDGPGAWLQSQLTSAGVDVMPVVRPGASSRLAVILVDVRSGARTVLEYRDPRLSLGPEELVVTDVSSGEVLLVDATDLPSSVRAARAARASGVATVADIDRPTPGVKALIAETDILVTSADFPMQETGATTVEAGLRQLAELGPELVVATLGSAGSVALHQGRLIRTPAISVETVDTTGAGDAFRAGLIAAWLKHGLDAEPEVLLRQANIVAGLSCRARGAQGGLPAWEDVLAWV